LGKDADVAGGIFNNGTIVSTRGNGINLGYREWTHHGWRTRAAALTGDIINRGLIEGDKYGIAALYGTMTGALINEANGTILGGNTAVTIADSFASWTGGIENHGLIEGEKAGIQIGSLTPDPWQDGVMFAGGIVNGAEGQIRAASGPAIVIGGKGFAGGLDNAGLIEGTIGVLIKAKNFEGGLVNDEGGVIEGRDGAGVWIDQRTQTFAGGISNKGKIIGATEGLLLEATEFIDGIVNATTAEIFGYRIAIRITGNAFSGGIDNRGLIDGTFGGISIESAVFNGGVYNGAQAQIIAHEGDAVFASALWSGAFENHGRVSGGARGFAYQGPGFNGSAINAGVIQGGDVAFFMMTPLFDGAFVNDGEIEGGADGVQLLVGQATGGFTNRGDIRGLSGTAVLIAVDRWGSASARADIRNTATGTIEGGDTGFWLTALEIYGDFINNGAIFGGGSDTGLFLDVASFFGDIINGGTIEAPTNAVALDIGTLDGEIVNSGTIRAGDANGIAVALTIGNGALFTNTGGGLLQGDVMFAGSAIYNFVAEEGAIEGDLLGQGGDDTITVRNGAHAFLTGADGSGVARDFASFSVEDGGFALMGARFARDTEGTGYAFEDVDEVTVASGGTLYLDKRTTLAVDQTLTLEPGGTLAFFLGAPGGDGFGDLTGVVDAAPEDYGQLLVDGAVVLDGAIVGYLDPAFAGANPALEAVRYNDVIVAGGGISGSFSTFALIAESSLFELNGIIDGNSVDFEVTRTSLAATPVTVVVNIGGPFDALVNERSNGMGSTSCGLAGDGWCLNRFAQNDPGATQVMTDATPGEDPFAWLRTGSRRTGETSLWGRALGVSGETDGEAARGVAGTEFTVVGAIVGVDHVFSPKLLLGLAAQWTATDIDFPGQPNKARVESIEAGAYASFGDARLYLNANTSIIWHAIDVQRVTASGRAFADYNGTTVSAFAEAGRIFETEQGLRIQPFVSLSYSHLDTDDYGETGSGTLLDVSGATVDSLKSMLGLRVGYPIELDFGRRMVPEIRVAWQHEFLDEQASFLARIRGGPQPASLIFGERFSRDTVIAGAGVTVPIAAQSTVFLDYDANLNPDLVTHTASAGVRVIW
jgi:uncharacterized protein YhjY with autotransporter beta-barrel domain